MKKVSARQIRQVLASVPETLRKVAQERDYWRKEAQVRMRRDEAEKVARAMHDKGIEQHVPSDSLVENLEKAAARGELRNIERAVDLVGPDMGAKLAHIANDDNYRGGRSAIDALSQYLLTE